MQTQFHTDGTLTEHAGYYQVSGAYLYTVLHEVPRPLARVLLVGPFASERHNSYLPWVRWARYLAAMDIEVLRYDYRGIGESTGVFEEMSFDHWREDVTLLAGWLKSRSPEVPVILHGLEMGTLLAGQAFDSGIGSGLLLWSPPANAQQALRSTLLRWVGLEHLFKPRGEARPAAEYIQVLEQGGSIEVEGYVWSSHLWRDSFQAKLPASMIDEATAGSAYDRPVKIIKLDKQAAPLVRGGFVGHDEAKDFSWLFAPNADWITAVSRRLQGSIHETGN